MNHHELHTSVHIEKPLTQRSEGFGNADELQWNSREGRVFIYSSMNVSESHGKLLILVGGETIKVEVESEGTEKRVWMGENALRACPVVLPTQYH